jgi:hypothetical protein
MHYRKSIKSDPWNNILTILFLAPEQPVKMAVETLLMFMNFFTCLGVGTPNVLIKIIYIIYPFPTEH